MRFTKPFFLILRGIVWSGENGDDFENDVEK